MALGLKLGGLPPICAGLLAGATLLIAAGCGGSSAGSASSATAATASAARTAGVTPAAYAKAHHDVVSSAAVSHRPRHGTGGSEVNDDNPGQADVGDKAAAPAAGRNPCTLVSQAQAQAILGEPIGAPVQAPLGPTCIYRPAAHGHNFVTMTVESVDFAAIKAHLHNPIQLDIGGHTAYCGTYGQPTTFVPLASGRILAVTAPCVIGARFAAVAVPRVKTS